MFKNKLNTKLLLTGIILFFIAIEIIKDPNQSIESAKEGLYLWFNVLLPSLFPFILISDLMISFGVVDYFTRCLEPIMRPLFNVPGIGAFPLTMSVMSGYPVGSKITSKIRKEGLVTRNEANLLIGFCSTSGPLFILGSVTIGLLGTPELGLLLLIPHYLGALTIGLVLGLFNREKHNKKHGNHIMNDAIKTQNKSAGSIISKSVTDSMNAIITVGEFIIIYSVIINIVLQSNGFNLIINVLSKITRIEHQSLKAIFAGIIEITNGCSLLSQLNIPLINKILFINFIIGWGGLSIHSQAISFISETDIKPRFYLVSKALHGLLSLIYTYIIHLFFYKNKIVTTFIPYKPILDIYTASWLKILTSSTAIVFSLIMFLIIFSIFLDELIRRT